MKKLSVKFGLQEFMEIFGGGKTKASAKFNLWVTKSGKKKDDFNLNDVQKETGIPINTLLKANNPEHPEIKKLLNQTTNIDKKIEILKKIKINSTPLVVIPVNPKKSAIVKQKKIIPRIKKEKIPKEVESEYDKRIRLKYTDDKYFLKKQNQRNKDRKGK